MEDYEMKQTYQAPDTSVITMMHNVSILAGSPQPQAKRRIGYEVSDLYNAASAALEDSRKTIPYEVFEVSTFEGDPFGGHGQGNGGEGTRASSSLWDE